MGGILSAAGYQDFLANAEDAALELDETRREFVELVTTLADHPEDAWTAGKLASFCVNHRLLAAELGEGTPHSLATRLGTLVGRFIGESFPLPDGRSATFHKSGGRKGSLYRVVTAGEVPNLEPVAEPVPNLVSG